MKFNLSFLVFFISIVFLTACATSAHTTDNGASNIQKVRTYWNEVWDAFTIEGFQKVFNHSVKQFRILK